MKHHESVKIWNAYSARHILFSHASPSLEDREFRLARIGLAISFTLLGIVAIIEIAFLAIVVLNLLS
jgi:hypothetical protein